MDNQVTTKWSEGAGVEDIGLTIQIRRQHKENTIQKIKGNTWQIQTYPSKYDSLYTWFSKTLVRIHGTTKLSTSCYIGK